MKEVIGQRLFARAGLSDRPSECVDLDTWYMNGLTLDEALLKVGGSAAFPALLRLGSSTQCFLSYESATDSHHSRPTL